MNDISAIVLAAGMGKRMNSSIPKVLHTILDKPIIYWTLNLLKELNIKKTIVVTGYEAEKVENEINKETRRKAKSIYGRIGFIKESFPLTLFQKGLRGTQVTLIWQINLVE